MLWAEKRTAPLDNQFLNMLREEALEGRFPNDAAFELLNEIALLREKLKQKVDEEPSIEDGCPTSELTAESFQEFE